MSFFSRLFRSKPKLMTWQEFVEYFARRIQEELHLEAKIDWGETIASSPIIVHFSKDDEASFSTYLSNHYTSYLQNPEALEAIVAANLAVIYKIKTLMPVFQHNKFFRRLKIRFIWKTPD